MVKPGETTGTKSVEPPSPERATDDSRSCRPYRGWRVWDPNPGGEPTGTKSVEPPSPERAKTTLDLAAPTGAGGSGTPIPVMKPQEPSRLNLPALKGRQTTLDLPPQPGWRVWDPNSGVPQVPPPANIQRPSGTKNNLGLV